MLHFHSAEYIRSIQYFCLFWFSFAFRKVCSVQYLILKYLFLNGQIHAEDQVHFFAWKFHLLWVWASSQSLFSGKAGSYVPTAACPGDGWQQNQQKAGGLATHSSQDFLLFSNLLFSIVSLHYRCKSLSLQRRCSPAFLETTLILLTQLMLKAPQKSTKVMNFLCWVFCNEGNVATKYKTFALTVAVVLGGLKVEASAGKLELFTPFQV